MTGPAFLLIASVHFPKADADAALQRLRELRLHHWQDALYYRAAAKRCRAPWAIKSNNKVADMHLSAVQTLNDFFDSGDTAEHDAYMRASANLGQEL